MGEGTDQGGSRARPQRQPYANPDLQGCYGLATILIFVGAMFVAQGFGPQVPILVSLLVVAAAITATIAASLVATRGGKPGGGSEDTGSGSGWRSPGRGQGSPGSSER
jgi:hypothetical protein